MHQIELLVVPTITPRLSPIPIGPGPRCRPTNGACCAAINIGEASSHRDRPILARRRGFRAIDHVDNNGLPSARRAVCPLNLFGPRERPIPVKPHLHW